MYIFKKIVRSASENKLHYHKRGFLCVNEASASRRLFLPKSVVAIIIGQFNYAISCNNPVLIIDFYIFMYAKFLRTSLKVW